MWRHLECQITPVVTSEEEGGVTMEDFGVTGVEVEAFEMMDTVLITIEAISEDLEVSQNTPNFNSRKMKYLSLNVFCINHSFNDNSTLHTY